MSRKNPKRQGPAPAKNPAPSGAGTSISPNGSSDKIQALQQRIDQLEKDLEDATQPGADKERIREELVREVQQDEATIRAEHFVKLKANADEEISGLLAEATEKANAEAEAIRQQAKKDADAERKTAETDANKIRKDALAEAKATLAAKTSELKKWEQDLNDRETALKDSTATLEQREKCLKKAERCLADDREDLQIARDDLQRYKERLEERWAQCSPGRVQELELEISVYQQREGSWLEHVERLQLANKEMEETVLGTGGQSPDQLLAELEKNRDDKRRLLDKLAGYPTEERLRELEQRDALVDDLQDKLDDLRLRLREAEERIRRREFSELALEQASTEVDALKSVRRELIKSLEAHKAALDKSEGERFPALADLDTERSEPSPWESFPQPKPQKITLPDLVAAVLHQAASAGLNYTPTIVRSFIAGLASSRISILQGLSGTGKTRLPWVFCRAIGAQFKIVSVHSNWRDRYELLGYNNDFNKRFTETEFTQHVYEAGLPREEDVIWILVLDEMNLARVEYYFADFLSALELEPEKHVVHLLSEERHQEQNGGPQGLLNGRTLRISPNLWFVGTANQDESTLEITDKVYDRSHVIDFWRKEDESTDPGQRREAPVSFRHLSALFEAAKNNPSARLQPDEKAFIKRLDDELQKQMQITYGYRFMDQLRAFTSVFTLSGGDRADAFDLLIDAKLLRKIQHRHDSRLSDRLSAIGDVLLRNPWGSSMGICMDRLNKKEAEA